MNDDEYVAGRRQALKESVDFFASTNKIEREKMVVAETLTNLGVHYSENELLPVSDEPPDIKFRDAEFEIKEIMDPDRRRHLEYKEALEEALDATVPADFLESYTPPKCASIGDIYERVMNVASRLLTKYALDTCRNLDLLFYVNLDDVMGLDEAIFPDVTSLRLQPWRSVSFQMGRRTCVLAARDDAPDFLRAAMGRVTHREVGSA